uniref:Putative reverse transcriptase, RNA-dependent DNA polymerase, Gag-polypeptide of LTR copia-type n=1 Tax=Tanacetum cinerariifolium TaxID=118510 RepID=A0A699HTA0_TANCI|nr:putative reverse transcriptase, RNA-dependent DNA polymerase, Gag-polypeptide of LTR copia-type [Tanacetum cinerariifolium]
MKSNSSVDVEYARKKDLINFFDNQTSQRPYDDERATSVVDGSVPSFKHNTNTTLCQEENTTTLVNDQSSSEGKNTNNNLGKTQHDSVFVQKDVHTLGLRRSSRPSKLPARFNDYVIEAMNNEIKALNRNNTWYVCDLPYGRKAIGCKWIYKIKYKAFGKVERYKAREKVLAGVIKTVKVLSNSQTADIFTKCLGVVQHCLCCRNLGMQDVFAGELVGKEKERSQCQANKSKGMSRLKEDVK